MIKYTDQNYFTVQTHTALKDLDECENDYNRFHLLNAYFREIEREARNHFYKVMQNAINDADNVCKLWNKR